MERLQGWERLNDKIVIGILGILQTDQCGEVTRQKVKYTLTVLVSEIQKIFFLCIYFAIFHCMGEFLAAFLTIVALRIFTGGSHKKTMLGCFLHRLLSGTQG